MNTSVNTTSSDSSIEQKWVTNEELASFRADLDDLISRIPSLSDIDLEQAKEKLMQKIVTRAMQGIADRPEAASFNTESREEETRHWGETASTDFSTVRRSKNFEGFLGFLRGPDAGASTLSPKRFGEALNIDIQTLAKQAHVHRNTITRAPDAESVQGFLREALRVLRSAADVSHDIGHAIFWYRNEPLRVFGYKTAEQLVTEGRTEDLLRYIASLEAGAAG
jgi:hypothetical protein